jgi:hypothetical protein
MRKVTARLLVFLSIMLFASLAMGTGKSLAERSFEANLSGNEEVPPVQTNAKGDAKFQFSREGDKLTYRLTISNIRDVTAGCIQKGKRGENGPPVINLFTEPKKEDVTGTLLAEGKVEPYLLIGPLKGKPLHSLIQLMEAGEACVNIQTKKHPDGEIRGQIK